MLYLITHHLKTIQVNSSVLVRYLSEGPCHVLVVCVMYFCSLVPPFPVPPGVILEQSFSVQFIGEGNKIVSMLLLEYIHGGGLQQCLSLVSINLL